MENIKSKSLTEYKNTIVEKRWKRFALTIGPVGISFIIYLSIQFL